MFLGSTRNAAGTVVHTYRCDQCSTVFTVTGIGQVINRPCRLAACTSYDADLDLDLALSKGDVQLKSGDGRVIVMRRRDLDPNRPEFLQRTGVRRHPVVIIRVVPPLPKHEDPVEVNFVAATCKACNSAREFNLSTPLRSTVEIQTWLRTQLTPCECGHREADIAMRLDKTEPTAN